MVRKTSESALIGRENELGEMFDDLKQDKSIRLLIGESGIGKSALLDEYYRTLTEEMRDEVFVGYYSRDEVPIFIFSSRFAIFCNFNIYSHKLNTIIQEDI